MTERQWEVFFEIHHGLPREGPGGPLSTEIAYSFIRNLPPKPVILDIGCGPGAQTLLLADLSKGEIYAVDNHASFLDQLRQSVAVRGFGATVHPTLGDMANLAFKDDSFDVLWAEGSIFIIGVENGLRRWRPLLKEHGTIAFTEASWLEAGVPKELDQYWQEVYPGIRTIDETIQKIEESGFCSVGQFILPESDWWNDYYNPITDRLPRLSEKYQADREALEVVEMHKKEIEMYRRYSDFYGYVFYIAEKESKLVQRVTEAMLHERTNP